MSKTITQSMARQAQEAAKRYDRNYLYELVNESEAGTRLRDIAQMALAIQVRRDLYDGLAGR